IPTGQGFENFDNLSDLKKNVYILIVKRFLAIFYPAAEYNKISLTIKVDTETFFANEKVCINRGYLDVLKGETEEKENNIELLSKLRKGQKLKINLLETKEAETSPPSRYNSGSIILAMENAGKLIEDEALREQIKGAGIGTSATRAEIIKKLERIAYISINSKTQIITPTDKGEAIYDVVFASMPDMLNPELTASWEKGLDMVAKKEIEPGVFMEKLEKYIRNKIGKLVVPM
ncbi:MAG: DNA topoisomerase, partial [Bacilli bacterium]